MIRGALGLGADHDGGVLGPIGAGSEPFVAVDDPMIAVQHRRCLQLCRIGGGNLRLGHGKALAEFASYQGLHIVLFPFRRGVQLQHDGILQGVRAYGVRAQVRAANDLVDMHIIHERHALAANILGMAQGPQAGVLGLLLHRRQRGLAFRGVLIEALFQGIDHLFDEFLHPAAHFGPVDFV